jgi:predicted nucleic acid-binding Zn ribbon protein
MSLIFKTNQPAECLILKPGLELHPLLHLNLPMATYVYETIPAKSGEKPDQFEIQQSMKDAPLTRHPQTGQPIRRLISGGLGILGSSRNSSAPSSGHGCGPGSCGCGKF